MKIFPEGGNELSPRAQPRELAPPLRACTNPGVGDDTRVKPSPGVIAVHPGDMADETAFRDALPLHIFWSLSRIALVLATFDLGRATPPPALALVAVQTLEVVVRLWVHRMAEHKAAHRHFVNYIMFSYGCCWSLFVHATFTHACTDDGTCGTAHGMWLSFALALIALALPNVLCTFGTSATEALLALITGAIALSCARPVTGSQVEKALHLGCLLAGHVFSSHRRSFLMRLRSENVALRRLLEHERQCLHREEQRLENAPTGMSTSDMPPRLPSLDGSLQESSPARCRSPTNSSSSEPASIAFSEEALRIQEMSDICGVPWSVLTSYYGDAGYGAQAIRGVHTELSTEPMDRAAAVARLRRLTSSASDRAAEASKKLREAPSDVDAIEVDEVLLPLWKALSRTTRIFSKATEQRCAMKREARARSKAIKAYH